MNGDGRRSLVRVAAALGLVAGIALALVAHQQGQIEWNPTALRARIEALGWLAPIAFILAASLRPFLLLPSWVLMSAGGLLFGVLGGTAFGTIGFTVSAAVAFGIARGLGRDAVAGRLSGRVARLDAYLTRRGPLWIGIYTSLPVTPLTPAHAAAGLSGMQALGFVGAVAIALVPRTALFSYFGDTLASGDVQEILIALVVVAVAAAIGIQIARRVLGRSSAQADGGEDGAA